MQLRIDSEWLDYATRCIYEILRKKRISNLTITVSIEMTPQALRQGAVNVPAQDTRNPRDQNYVWMYHHLYELGLNKKNTSACQWNMSGQYMLFAMDQCVTFTNNLLRDKNAKYSISLMCSIKEPHAPMASPRTEKLKHKHSESSSMHRKKTRKFLSATLHTSQIKLWLFIEIPTQVNYSFEDCAILSNKKNERNSILASEPLQETSPIQKVTMDITPSFVSMNLERAAHSNKFQLISDTFFKSTLAICLEDDHPYSMINDMSSWMPVHMLLDASSYPGITEDAMSYAEYAPKAKEFQERLLGKKRKEIA